MPIKQLDNVEIGDLVLLTKYDDNLDESLHIKDYEVAGFVDKVRYSSKRNFVRISHENSYISDACMTRRNPMRSAGDRWYDLSEFDDYKVLMKKSDRHKKENL